MYEWQLEINCEDFKSYWSLQFLSGDSESCWIILWETQIPHACSLPLRGSTVHVQLNTMYHANHNLYTKPHNIMRLCIVVFGVQACGIPVHDEDILLSCILSLFHRPVHPRHCCTWCSKHVVNMVLATLILEHACPKHLWELLDAIATYLWCKH